MSNARKKYLIPKRIEASKERSDFILNELVLGRSSNTKLSTSRELTSYLNLIGIDSSESSNLLRKLNLSFDSRVEVLEFLRSKVDDFEHDFEINSTLARIEASLSSLD